MSKKVAYLALTYSAFQKEDLMSEYFDKQYSHLFNLYIHPKTESESAFKESHIPFAERIHNTEWGFFSLVSATVALLKNALRDTDNEKFILISDSHLPLYNIKRTCEMLLDESCITSFSLLEESLAPYRFFKMFKLNHSRVVDIPFSVKDAVFSSQWFVCTRAAAVKFVEGYEKYESYFDKESLTLADECWFGTMANHLGIPWQNKAFCFADWDWETDDYMIARGCKKNPHTFGVVTNEDVDRYRKDGYIFIRKIHSSTLVDADYILKE